jgi:hypothetical protein
MITRPDALLRRLVDGFTLAPPRTLAVAEDATTLVVPVNGVALSYGVVATPSWLTTIAVTGRSDTAATLTFGTAAPAGAVVHVITMRT